MPFTHNNDQKPYVLHIKFTFQNLIDSPFPLYKKHVSVTPNVEQTQILHWYSINTRVPILKVQLKKGWGITSLSSVDKLSIKLYKKKIMEYLYTIYQWTCNVFITLLSPYHRKNMYLTKLMSLKANFSLSTEALQWKLG